MSKFFNIDKRIKVLEILLYIYFIVLFLFIVAVSVVFLNALFGRLDFSEKGVILSNVVNEGYNQKKENRVELDCMDDMKKTVENGRVIYVIYKIIKF